MNTTETQDRIASAPKSPLEIVDETIAWTRRQEGHYYGDGTAALMTGIRDELLKAIGRGTGFTPARLRRLVTKVLRKHAKLHGQTPSLEVASRPASAKGYVGAGSEYAGWEAGPYEWAIQTAGIINLLVPNVLAEPYYSFDLCFREA